MTPDNPRKIWAKIIRESILILIAASVISTIGGFGAEALAQKFIIILPLLILLPAVNDMVGDFGTIVASRFTTLLYLGKIHEKNWARSKIVRQMLFALLGVAIFAAFYLSALSTIIALVKGWQFQSGVFLNIIFVALTATILLALTICAVSIKGGFYVFRKGHDPDNYLIPLATSIADMGNLLVMSLLLALIF